MCGLAQHSILPRSLWCACSPPPDFIVRPLHKTLSAAAPLLGKECLQLVEASRAAWEEAR